MKTLFAVIACIFSLAAANFAQTNKDPIKPPTESKGGPRQTTAVPPNPTVAPKPSRTPPPTPAATPAPKRGTTTGTKPPVTAGAGTPKQSTAPDPAESGVRAAFASLLDGIRKVDIDKVTNSYWNSPKLTIYNYNGTVTRGWTQVRQNLESSYPQMREVSLDVHDERFEMLGHDGAIVSCLWTQTQVYKGTPETATGRMTLAYRRVGGAWKIVQRHTSPDNPDPTRIPQSETTAPKMQN